MSAAIDIVAHEWGHAVSKWSPADFPGMCPENGWEEHPDECEMSEGFADVVGHMVERFNQPTPDAGSWIPDRWDWIQGEDWAPECKREFLRRAHEYDAAHTCPHWSVHANDPGCRSDGTPEHENGNRLSVVLRLMAEGGHNPAYYHSNLPFQCTGCDIDVTPLDPDAMTSFEMAARVLFRVLDTESTSSTNDWDLLPYLARNAAWDLFPDRCEETQTTVIEAFRAVGYPQQLMTPCTFCPPYAECPPCCPPDHCCGGVEE
jgi:Zn-dependent metalloprotease